MDQLGATRRSGRRLLLTTRGRFLHDADTATLWAAVAQTLIPTEAAGAAAAEIALSLLLTPGLRVPAVADALTGEGWRTQDGGPRERHRLDDRRGPRLARVPPPHRQTHRHRTSRSAPPAVSPRSPHPSTRPPTPTPTLTACCRSASGRRTSWSRDPSGEAPKSPPPRSSTVDRCRSPRCGVQDLK
jgi:hypothetical protein